LDYHDIYIYKTAYQKKWYVVVRSLHPDFVGRTEQTFPANQAK